MEDRKQVWESLLKLSGSGDSHVRDRAGDIMVRIFHQLPDQKSHARCRKPDPETNGLHIPAALKALRTIIPSFPKQETRLKSFTGLQQKKGPICEKEGFRHSRKGAESFRQRKNRGKAVIFIKLK
ncbi:hypothetical protein [Methanosarcina horonobensis]|uniref:hypothetical protein n=1 Tax=Methanosarcina horonobensis TaxID=418008 RepID=UPI0022B87FC3|nr:hypothetical protein [Methanosarcina horonobensis]